MTVNVIRRTKHHEGEDRNLRPMRLRYVGVADFRRSELYNYREVVEKQPELADLKPGEVVCLRSGTGTQIVFVLGVLKVEGRLIRGRESAVRHVLRSERLRITDGGEWDDLMVVDYAERVGIRLVGLSDLRDHFRELVAATADVRKADK